MIKSFVLLLLVSLSISAGGVIEAAPGNLDSSFGKGGRVLTRYPVQSDTFLPRSNSSALAVQPDGKIVSVGEALVHPAQSAERFAFAITRYNSDGSLDQQFGSGGKRTTRVGLNDRALAVALHPNGKIVAAGYATLSEGNFAFAVVRYLPDGTLDRSFHGDGKLVTDITPRLDEVSGLAIQPDNKIVVAGFANAGAGATDFALVRYNPNGSLDASFGKGGIVQTDFAGDIDGASEMALLANGKIVVAGATYNSSTGAGDVALLRYNPDGTLDETFGTGGKVRTNLGGDDSAADLAISPGNKIVIAGATGRSGTFDMAVVRYLPDGRLDRTFAGDGKFIIDFAGFGTVDAAKGVAVQPNGKIVVAGDTSRFESGNGGFDFAVLRLNQNGSIDQTFGGDGRVLIDFGGLAAPGHTNDDLADVVIQPDGNIVVSGDAEVESNRLHDTALARLLGEESATAASAVNVEQRSVELD